MFQFQSIFQWLTHRPNKRQDLKFGLTLSIQFCILLGLVLHDCCNQELITIDIQVEIDISMRTFNRKIELFALVVKLTLEATLT